MEYLLLIIGFVLLIKGADFFVEGSSSLARFLKIPSVIIGLTIVAMGTSAPEASVSINAALAGNNDIAVSNVIGSNIFNGLVVVGICAFMAGFKTNRDILKRDMPVNILITFILYIMIANGKISRIEGIILLVGMIFYILNMIRDALKKRNECPSEQSIPLYKALPPSEAVPTLREDEELPDRAFFLPPVPASSPVPPSSVPKQPFSHQKGPLWSGYHAPPRRYIPPAIF